MKRSIFALIVSLMSSQSAILEEEVSKSGASLRGSNELPFVRAESLEDLIKVHFGNIKVAAIENSKIREFVETESIELEGIDTYAHFTSGVFSQIVFNGASSCNANPLFFFQKSFGPCEVLPPNEYNDPPTGKWVKYWIDQNAAITKVNMQAFTDAGCTQSDGTKKQSMILRACNKDKQVKGSFTESFALDFQTASDIKNRYHGIIYQRFTTSNCSPDSLVQQYGYIALSCQRATDDKGNVSAYIKATDIDLLQGDKAMTVQVYGRDDKYCHGKFDVFSMPSPFPGGPTCSPDPDDNALYSIVSKF